ncbi:non-ribosomal peptide synthetase [Streptomyces albiaxialis]|uniref:Phenyloxazoline synthase MbtB n=1 Tax=Streptomyces albiaxialis TaxID=329523 RepID=A0ABN2VPW5_9ACTN
MSPADIIDELHSLGVQLWSEDGQIRFRAPQGVLTEDWRGALRAHKSEIVALLDREGAAENVTVTPEPDPAAAAEPFPLTDVQSAYLLGRRDSFGHGGVACHGYLEVGYPAGAVRPEALEDAWNRLIARHGMLRAVVSEDGYQRVLPEDEVRRCPVPATDLREAPGDKTAAHLDAVREELGHRTYDTAVWPLFELRLTRAPDGDIVHFSLDSLIADWGSAGILLDELDTLLADGPGAALPELEISFRDYLLAERRLRHTARYRRARDYWRARLPELPPAPALPERATGAISGRFVRHRLVLPADAWARLRQRASGHGLTAANVVLAAYASVLDRWSGHSRFTLNLTLLNRLPLHPQVDRLVGDFTSVSLLAVEDLAGTSLRERADRLGTRLFTDLDHRLHSGVEVIRDLARERGREAALMPVVFTSALGLGPGASPRSGRTLGAGITQTPQVTLDCQASDGGGTGPLEVNWDVREGAFPEGVVEDMFAAFRTLLTSLAEDPAAWDEPDPVPLPAWQAREREEANDTAGPLPGGLLHEGFLARAAQAPEAVALVSRDGELTYGALARHAAAVAGALRGAGCGPGDRIAVVMDKGPEQIAAVLGTLLAGCAYVPVDTTQPRLRGERLLADARVRHVLTQSWVETARAWPAGLDRTSVDLLTPVPDWADARRTGTGAETGAGAGSGGDGPDAPAYVIYTSGSTGDPKGVVISHRAALNTVGDISARYSVTARDRVLGLAQLGFDLSVYDVFGTLAAGGTLVLPDPARGADPSHWAELLAAHDVTVWNSVPAQLHMLTDYWETEPPPGPPALRLALLSGDWIPVTLPGRVGRHVPELELISLGGATEAAIWSIHHPITTVDPAWTSIPYGRPLRNQGFRVLDEDGRDCPVWVRGELCITGEGLALGYFGDEDLTARRFPAHPADGTRLYRTGDLGRYLPGGEIEFLGREDGQVKVRGHRVELGEVEAALLAHPDVGAAAVTLGDGALLGFVEAARTRGEGEDEEAARERVRVRETAARFAARHVEDVRGEDAGPYVAALHRAAHLSMLHTLGGRGAFADGAAHTADEVLDRTGVHERHRWLVRHWLESLTETGLLVRGDGGHGEESGDGGHGGGGADPAVRYAAPLVPGAEEVSAAWDRVERYVASGLCTAAFVDYHRAHAERLGALLDDTQNPFELLFPQGGTGPARAVYRDDAVSRYLNHAAAAVVHRAAAAHQAPDARPLRVLELGAGTGAATSAVVPLLDGFDVDYLFTDVTPFFLPQARAEFEGHAGMRYAVVDVDGDPRAQGLAPNSADVVLCAGMLNSARDTGRAVRTAVGLLAPGGLLVVTEPTGRHPHILLTQGFMMEPDGGDREHGAVPLLPAGRWRELLAAAGAEEVLSLPEDGHPLAAPGMRLFAARAKTDRRAPHPDALAAFLAERLPPAMVPAHLQVVDALPVTGNGKIDRATLAGWRPAALTGGEDAAPATSAGGLEERLAALWAEALGVARVAPDDNFYDRGADSLILARAAGRLREEIPEAAAFSYDALLRQMLNEPDLLSLAAFLRTDTDTSPGPGPGRTAAGTGGNALLVPFDGGGDGDTVRVMFHAALGTMDYFQHLGRALAAQRLGPVLGVAVADAETYSSLPPERLVATVADGYARRLADEGHTRFQLIGYCLGGLLATEVARRLTERGLEVADLTLVDSIPMFLGTDEELAFESIFVPNLGLDPVPTVFGEDVEAADVYRAIDLLAERHGGTVPAGALGALDGDPGLEAVAAAARRAHARGQDERLAAYARAAEGNSGVPVDAELVPALFRVCRHSMIAARFDPEPYAGDMRFLRAAEQQSFGVTAGVGHLAAPFWERACLGRFAVTDVPGNHFSVIEPPHVATVAQHLALPLQTRPAP